MASGSRRPHGSSSSSISRSTSSSISGSSSSATSSQWTMNLMVNNSTGRVEYAEASKDVVDYLFSLLTMPIGQLFKLLRDSRISMVGCVGDLYESVEKLETRICPQAAKDALLRPTAMGGYQSGNRLLLTDGSSSSSSNARSYTNHSGYVKDIENYMVKDNLEVTPPSNIRDITTLLNRTDINSRSLSLKTVQIGHKEGLKILKASLRSKTVLTDVFLGGASRRA